RLRIVCALLGPHGTMAMPQGAPFRLFSFRRYRMMFRNWWRRMVDRKQVPSPRSRRPACTRLQVEPLEIRAVPAGDVAAFLLGGALIVLGDGTDNDVEILVSDGNLVVQGREGTDTTVNGDSRAVFKGVDHISDDLRVFLGHGNDLLDVRGVGVGGDVSIQVDG